MQLKEVNSNSGAKIYLIVITTIINSYIKYVIRNMIFIRIQKVLWNLSATLFSGWVLIDMMLWSEFETVDENISGEYDVIIGRYNHLLIDHKVQY